MANTSPPPCIEWHVETECKRNFCWSAPDMSFLLRDLTERGYRATRIMPQHEWEAEQDWEQRKLNHEHEKEIERRSA